MLPLLGAGAGLIGSIFSSMTSASNTQDQIAASQQQQATANAFTERMSDTAYTRATADMKNAGLNPMMMFGSGSAASTPSASSIQAPMPQTTSPIAGIGNVVSKALDTQIQQQTLDKTVAEIANLKTQSALTEAQRITESQKPGLVNAETGKATSQITLNEQQATRDNPATQEAAGVTGNLSPKTIGDIGTAKYVSGAAGDVAAPVVNSATRILGIEALKNAFKSGKSATSYRNGFNAAQGRDGYVGEGE